MLTCRELAQRRSSDYLDGQLSTQQRIGFRLHLMLCKHCRVFIRQLSLVRKVLATRSEIVPEAVVQPMAAHLHHHFVQQGLEAQTGNIK